MGAAKQGSDCVLEGSIMQAVRCPHCSAELAYDASLANQVTSCGVCGQLFQMPALAEVPEVPQSRDDLALGGPEPEPEAEPQPEREAPTRRKRAGQGMSKWQFIVFTIIAVGVLPLITLGVVLSLVLSRVAEKSSRPERPHPVVVPRKK